MKLNKKGEPKLEKGEVRIGNFFIKDEPEHIKLTDLNFTFVVRIRKDIPAGMFFKQYVDESARGSENHQKGVGNIMAVLWSVLATVPDVEFLETVYYACEDCMKRHPEAYGMPKDDATEEQQREAEEEYKEMMDFEQGVSEYAEKEDLKDGGTEDATDQAR